MKYFLSIFFIILIHIHANPDFSSQYTDFSKDCIPDPTIKDGDIPLICKGPRDLQVYISYSACFEYLQILKQVKSMNLTLPPQLIGSSDKKKLEWRLFSGKVMGIIYRTHELEEDFSGSCPTKKKQDKLEIRTLAPEKKSESIPSTTGSNEKARQVLDKLISDSK